jgi:hypothetical protein
MLNAGMISLVFPFAVFGYALMEEERPGKKFWDFAIKYTLFVLFMKFIIQLDWYVFAEDLAFTIEEYSVSFILSHYNYYYFSLGYCLDYGEFKEFLQCSVLSFLKFLLLLALWEISTMNS